MVKILKAKEEKQKVIPPQLLTPLNESKLRSFFKNNGANRKMTSIKAAMAI